MKVLQVLCLLILGMSLTVDAMHGGHHITIENVPYNAQFNQRLRNRAYSFCGAAILSENWVLTAAQCITAYQATTWYRNIRVGANTILRDGTAFNVSEVILHEKANGANNDLALMKLATPMKFDATRQPIKISRVQPKIGDTITLTGYGDDYLRESKEHLQIGQQTVTDFKECFEMYRQRSVEDPTHESYAVPLGDKVFCASPESADFCPGDTGGPVVLNGKLVGIMSEGCQSPLPNVHVDVTKHCNWIEERTGLKLC